MARGERERGVPSRFARRRRYALAVASLQPALVRHVAAHGLASLRLGYAMRDDGTFYFRGTRPGSNWHAHGSLRVHPHDLIDGRLVQLVLDKQRWRLRGTNYTRHSRPPDDLGRRYTATVIAIGLFAWLDAGLGLHRHAALFEDLDDKPSRRTLQRWLSAALPWGTALQHHLRGVLLDLPESRPPEDLFPGGVPPPARDRRQRWREPGLVWRLHRALTMLFGASIALRKPSSSLLAEALRRAATEHRRSD